MAIHELLTEEDMRSHIQDIVYNTVAAYPKETENIILYNKIIENVDISSFEQCKKVMELIKENKRIIFAGDNF